MRDKVSVFQRSVFFVISFVLIIFSGVFVSLKFRKLIRSVFADVPEIVQKLYIASDGTSPFDATTWDGVVGSPTQGTDSDTDNRVVRVQDKITYTVEQSVNEADATNVTSIVTLSPGQRWVSLPKQCLTVDVTPVSSISADGLTLTCNTGNQSAGSELLFSAGAMVNTASNGDYVWASSTIQSDDTAASSPPETDHVLVTTGFGIDVANTMTTAAGPTTGSSGESGQIVSNKITIRLKKGSELPQNTSQTFSFSYTASNSPVNWVLYDWNSNVPCKDLLGNIGNIVCTKSGNSLTVNITNINYAAATNPINALYEFQIVTWIPNTDALAAPGMSLSYTTRIDFTPIPIGESGIPSNGTGVETNEDNNTASAGYLASTPGTYCSFLTADGGNKGGCGGAKDGTATTTLGVLRTSLSFGSPLEFLIGSEIYKVGNNYVGVNRVKCIKVDHRYFDYINAFGNMFNAWGDRRYYSQSYVPPSDRPNFIASPDIPDPIMEYSTTPITLTDSALQSQKCDSSLSWSATIPANLSDITAIRIRYIPTVINPAVDGVFLHTYASYKIKDTISPMPSAGDKFPIYGHVATISADGNTYDSTQDVVYNSDMDPQYSNPANTQYGFNNYNIARLNFVSAQMDVSKSNANGTQTISPGGVAKYTITPTVFGDQSVVNGVTFTIEDQVPTDRDGNVVVTYMNGSSHVSGTNGTYSGPVLESCTLDNTKTCLKWTLTNVTSNQDVATVTYSLRANDLSNLPSNAPDIYNFTNTVHILSDSDTVNLGSDIDKDTPGIQYPKSSVTLNLLVRGGYYVFKTPDKNIYPINNPDDLSHYPLFTINYQNNGSKNLTSGAIIDVLSYNGDNENKNRVNTFDLASPTASKFTDTSAKGFPGLAAAPILPAGTSIQYVTYDAANNNTFPENIYQDPCHVSNLPSGFDPLSSPTHYCYLLRFNGGQNDGVLPGGGTVGTGTTPWSSTVPTDFNSVVAFRVITQPLAVGSPIQSIDYRIHPLGNKSGDVYCNNFSSRVPQISLEVRSNTVCAMVVGVDLELEKQIDGNNDGIYNKVESIKPDNPFTYKVEIKNTYGVEATNVEVEDIIPIGITVNSVDVDQGTTVIVAGTPTKVQWTVGSIKVGESKFMTIHAVLHEEDVEAYKKSLTNGGTSRNLVEISNVDQTDIDSVPDNISDPFDPDNHEDDESFADSYLPLSIGDTVWDDKNVDGRQNTNEPGIPGVKIFLFVDTDNDGLFDSSKDTQVSKTVTDNEGKYYFGDLIAGNYFIVIPADQFLSSPLYGYKLTLGRTADPNDNQDLLNDGVLLLDKYITTPKAVNLTYGEEPTSGGYENLTIDFGFYYSKLPDLPSTGISRYLVIMMISCITVGIFLVSKDFKKKQF